MALFLTCNKTTFVLLMFLVNFVVAASRNNKKGFCPLVVQSGVCSYTCLSDYECPGRKKCCRTQCGGSFCTAAIYRYSNEVTMEKSGTCPSQPKGRWICSSRCSKDVDCRGIRKCCRNRCGALACMNPEKNDLTTRQL